MLTNRLYDEQPRPGRASHLKPDRLHETSTGSAHRIATVSNETERTRAPQPAEDPSMIPQTRRLPLLVGLVALTTLTAACGETRQSSSTTEVGAVTGARTVDVAMEDIEFDQTTLTVKTGETIDFRFTNTGQIAHDAFIGDDAAQKDHEAEMGEMGDAEGHGMKEGAIALQPGESGQLSYTFSEPGTFEVGCHQPGHYAAGMKIDVTVE